MGKPLDDVPDGMQVNAINDLEEGPMLEFYTGRWTIQYSRSEVEQLIAALQSWLRETR